MVERNCEGTLLKKRTRGEKEAATYDEGRKERKKITCLILNAGCAALVRTHNTHYTHLLWTSTGRCNETKRIQFIWFIG